MARDRWLKWGGLIGCMLVVCAVFVVTWVAHPYFFLHDDNRIQYLPYFVHNARAAEEGRIALYNWYQFRGTPHLANGNAAALYPLTVIGVEVSRLFLGHPFAGIDVIVLLHALIGVAGMQCLGARLGWGRGAQWIASVTWPLLSFFFYVGNSWFIATAAVAWLPWMLGFAMALKQEGRWRWAGLLAMMRVMHFLAGHPQFFVYSVIAEVLWMLGLIIADAFGRETRKDAGRFLRRYAVSFVLTLFGAMPLLMPLLRQLKGSIRASALDYETFISGSVDLTMWLRGLTQPYEGHVFQTLSFLGWAGLILVGMGVVLTGVLWVVRTPETRLLRVSMLTTIVLGAFIFAWAANLAGVNQVIYRLPFLNQFRWPFKLLIQFGFMVVLLMGSAATVLGRAFRSKKTLARMGQPLAVLLTVAQAAQFGGLYARSEQRSLRLHPEPIPFSDPWVEKVKGGRVISVGFDYIEDPTMATMAFDYATLWGVDQMAGYDAMQLLDRHETQQFFGLYSAYYDDRRSGKETLSERFESLSALGAQYFIMHPEYVAAHGDWGMTRLAEEEGRLLYENPEAKPLVFVERGEVLYSVERSTNAMVLEIETTEPGFVTVNVFPDERFVVTVDGQESRWSDEGHQVHVLMTAGAHQLELRYVDPAFNAGVMLAFVGTALVVAAVIIGSRAKKKEVQDG